MPITRQTFTWALDSSWSNDESPKVLSIKFGDTYEQRVGNGVNTQPNTFAVSFTGTFTVAKAIRTFLRDKAGTLSFIWVNPFNESGFYLARKWSFKRTLNESGALYTVESVFEQVFE